VTRPFARYRFDIYADYESDVEIDHVATCIEDYLVLDKLEALAEQVRQDLGLRVTVEEVDQ
jgi:hypothetical protein